MKDYEKEKEARDFLIDHPPTGLPLVDTFRSALAEQIKDGVIEPAKAGTQLEMELIDEVFEKQAEDSNA